MKNSVYSERDEQELCRGGKVKSIHKKWVDFPSAAKALLTDLCIVLQLVLLALLYAFFALKFRIFFYISIGLTALAGMHVFICERDAQSKSSWLFLFLISFGCGYIVYILADKRVCYGYDKRRYAKIYKGSKRYVSAFTVSGNSGTVKNDCEYIYNSGGYATYQGTDLKYFSNASTLFENMLADLENATQFIFFEYFIVSEGALFEKLYDVLSRKAAGGVEVRFLCDDAGSQGVLKAKTKKRISNSGINFKVFQKLFSPFSFGLNYRDHRKIVVIDGKCGYVGGCNIADECVNARPSGGGRWKDAGLRLEGAAVDGLTLTYIRQWELAVHEKTEFGKYLNKFEITQNTHNVVPYAGGPELDEALCRGVYSNIIAGARNKLYIMTPYLIPDGDMFAQLKAKAQSGVDVRIVLPEVPDYPFIYLVTRSNAERLQKYGVKIHYVSNTFLHSKVMLSENCMTVGSVNMDMRAFYLEFDNGVYTDDVQAMSAVESDFKTLFAENSEQPPVKHNIFVNIATAVLRIVSPLM